MRKTTSFFISALIAFTTTAYAQGRGNQAPQFNSPEVQADRKVTFRLYAPQAQAVRLSAGDIQGLGQNTQLTKAENGVWEITVGPIDGFLSYTDHWKVLEAKADASAAWVTSRLEFYRNPLWMKQFPFAHAIEMTYRLQGGLLEVRTRIENLSTDPMPVSIGFHPYFQLTDSPRDEWTIAVAATTHWLLAPNKIPTGETQPIAQVFPDPAAAPLKDHDLDHVFGDLVRDSSGGAVMTVKGKSQQLDVIVGPLYKAMVIYAPKPQAGSAQNRNFICFEPMVGITNAMNLAHKGLYKELQSIPPGGAWQESFWVRPRGF